MAGAVRLKRILFLVVIVLMPGGLVYAQQELILKLKNPNPVIRMNAAQELGNQRVEEAVPALIKALKDESPGVRINTIVSLGYLRDKRAIEPLIKVLKEDKNRGVRIMAAQTLGRFTDKRVVEVLGEMAADGDSGIKEAAYRSLGKVGGPKEVDKLLYALENDTHTLVRQSAIGALTNLTEMGREGKRRVDIEKAIRRAQRSRNKKVRDTARHAREKLKKVPKKEEGNETR